MELVDVSHGAGGGDDVEGEVVDPVAAFPAIDPVGDHHPRQAQGAREKDGQAGAGVPNEGVADLPGSRVSIAEFVKDLGFHRAVVAEARWVLEIVLAGVNAAERHREQPAVDLGAILGGKQLDLRQVEHGAVRQRRQRGADDDPAQGCERNARGCCLG